MKKSVLLLLMSCMSLCSYSQSYWYYGTVEDLNNGSAPIPEKAIAYTNADYQTYDATESVWYKLDTSVEKLRIPYALFLSDNNACVAVPVSSGISDIIDTTNTSMIGISIVQSNKTINGIDYIVWTSRGIGRLMGYLINSNPTAIKGVKTTQANGGATCNLAGQKVTLLIRALSSRTARSTSRSNLWNMELVYIYSIMSLLALVGIIWLQIKMRKDKRGIL